MLASPFLNYFLLANEINDALATGNDEYLIECMVRLLYRSVYIVLPIQALGLFLVTWVIVAAVLGLKRPGQEQGQGLKREGEKGIAPRRS